MSAWTMARRRPLAVAIGVLAASAGAPAFSQDVRVEVTGSNIKRVDVEGALPVQIITRADIEREGLQTATAVVERLSANSSIGGLNLSGGQGGTNVGYAAASLRGLGGQRTLVLLNGRRLANTAFVGTMVDINSIPLSAIDRVEVLTDGASAIYGTDAIAGVINFVLRKEFSGVEVNAYYGDSQQGGGAEQRYNVTAGWGDLARDRVNVFASVDYNKRDEIAARDRPFSRSAYIPDAAGGAFDKTSGNSFPGNVFLPAVGDRAGDDAEPDLPGCQPPYSFPTSNPATAGQCRFDYASVIDIVPPSESWNVVGAGRWRFAADHEAFVEAAWSRTESISRVSPSPVLLGDDPLRGPGAGDAQHPVLSHGPGPAVRPRRRAAGSLLARTRAGPADRPQHHRSVALRRRAARHARRLGLLDGDQLVAEQGQGRLARRVGAGIDAAAHPQQRPHQPVRLQLRRGARRAADGARHRARSRRPRAR